MPNPYDNLRFSQSQYIPQYHGAPIDEFKELLQKRETDYNANIAAVDQLELVAADLDINDADYTVKKQAIDDIRTGIQGIADTGGAYEFAGKQVRQLAKNFTTNQGLKAAVENQATITARKKELQDLYLSNKISVTGYEHAVSKLDAYGGVGEGKDNIYDKPEIYDPAKFTDVGDKLNKFGTGWKADSINQGWILKDDGWYHKDNITAVSPNEIREAMLDFAHGDADIMATVDEYAEITGEDMLTPLIEAQADKQGFTIKDSDIKADTLGIAQRKAAALAARNAGRTMPVLINTKGHQIGSAEAKHAELATISDQKVIIENTIKELTNDNANLNENEIKANKQALQALEEKEIQIKNYDLQLKKQVISKLKAAGIVKEDVTAETYEPDTNTITKAKELALTEGIKTFAPASKKNVTEEDLGLARQWAEDNYIDFMDKVDPVLIELEKLYKEGAKDNVTRANITYSGDKKEREEMTNWSQAVTGIGLGKPGEELGEGGADVLALGFQWYGTIHKGASNVDADALKGATGIEYVGTSFDATSGSYKYIFNIQGNKGEGLVSLGADVIHRDIIGRGEGSPLTAHVGSHLSQIDNNTYDGEGEIPVAFDENGNPTAFVKVKSYTKSTPEIQRSKQGLYEIIVPVINSETGEIEDKSISAKDRVEVENIIADQMEKLRQ